MKKGLAALLAVAVAGAAAGGVYHFYIKGNSDSDSGRVSSDAENAVYVTSVSSIAGLGSGSGQIQRYAGVVVPQETWSAKLEGDKKVKETYVKEGDTVKKGDKLFTYDTSEDEDKLAQDEIDIERAKNDIETSKAQVEQLEKEKAKAKADDQLSYTTQILSEQNSIKQNEYDIKTKQLEIESLKVGIEDSDVVSKIDGVVKKVANPNSNDYTTDTSDAYITIMQIGDYRVQATVNEQNIGLLAEQLPVLCYSRVDSTKFWKGTITKIKRDSGTSNADSDGFSSDSSDSGTNSSNYPFYIQLENSDDLMLGQHLYVELDEGQSEKKDGIWIPEYYITQDETGAWVWAASSANVLEKRKVTLGSYDEDQMTYEITEGLSAEDYMAAPDEAYSEGDPLIYNEENEDIYDYGEMSTESMYGAYDLGYDGSLEGEYFDDGSFWSDEDWDDSSYTEYDFGSVYDEDGSYYEDEDIAALMNAGALPEEQNG